MHKQSTCQNRKNLFSAVRHLVIRQWFKTLGFKYLGPTLTIDYCCLGWTYSITICRSWSLALCVFNHFLTKFLSIAQHGDNPFQCSLSFIPATQSVIHFQCRWQAAMNIFFYNFTEKFSICWVSILKDRTCILSFLFYFISILILLYFTKISVCKELENKQNKISNHT